MAIVLLGKIVITVVTVTCLAAMGVVIYFVVTDDTYVATTTQAPPATEPSYDPDVLRVGVGIADMTGPCVEITFMGYAEVTQRGQGIHTRQFSRAFVFAQNDTRVVLVTAEVQAVGLAVRREVVRRLRERYGDMYSLRNVILTGTHTHSGPGGHLEDFLLDVTILGFSRETFVAYVEGITRSIIRAHENMTPARLFYGTTQVKNAHMNRSPFSYDFNPEEERERYDNNTDDTLTLVRIERLDGRLHGIMSWFAVHTTSMNMTNHLISSDNLGYASMRLEQQLNPGALVGKGSIVAGFFSSNLGDLSPNTQGPRCEFSGAECDNQFTTCASGERCFARGPGEDMFDSTRIIGTAVYEGALEVLNAPGEELTGPVRVLHQFVDMPNATAPLYDAVNRTFNESNIVSGCLPAMGVSFAAGTQDGANTLNITHGVIEGNSLLESISHLVIAEPSPEDVECHDPKPILLMTGRANFPLPWHPRIISTSVIWLGGLAVLGLPGEATTMAGRRMRSVVEAAMEEHGLEPRVVVSGMTNEYIHYVVTYEEYQVQRYEAASTIYGPHTLDIFLDRFRALAQAAMQGSDVPAGPEPLDNSNRTLSLNLPVVADGAGRGRRFGDVLQQPPLLVRRGDVVTVAFVAANPRNDLMQESSHVVVERQQLGQWRVIATDADWDTTFRWIRQSTIAGTSRAEFTWLVPPTALVAPYRIVYRAAARGLLSGLEPFTAITRTFTIDVS